jgi:hypothetical protein
MFDITRLTQDFGNEETNRLASELKGILEQSKFDIRSPLTFTNHGSGPVFDIIQRGVEQHRVISAVDEDGAIVELGIGAGSRGISASEFIPDTNFALDPTLINEVFSTQGRTPSDPTSSLLGTGRSGNGIPHTRKPYVPVAGWSEALAGLQKSEDNEHAPDSAVKVTRDGNQYWWCNEPWKWQLVRCTVTAINADTLTCSVVAYGKVTAETITVAKPCHLRQTLWDGLTIDGQTYTYTDSQSRECTDGYTPEDQVVYPSYSTTTCPTIFALWTGNDTGASTGWQDVNVDARHWVAE